jgi:DNA repair exonuclease SbcCD nuclease subunit
MVKAVIHLADIHIRTFRMHDENLKIFKKFINQVKNLIKDYNREEIRIVVVGDLLHQKIIISNEQLMLATWFLNKLEELAPTVLIAGNHDLLENNKDRMDSITPMVQFLGRKELNYFKESKCYLDDNIVWCVYSIFEENKRPNIESAREEFGNDKRYIGLFHGPIIGLKTDLGYVIDHGYDLEIFDGCDMVLCGDIHKRGSLVYKETPVVMSGSLQQQNFGEKINNHGFLFWDVETKTYTEHNIDNEFSFYQFKIKSIDDINNESEILTNLE